MKRLIFNPDKDMKELEKYGFEYMCLVWNWYNDGKWDDEPDVQIIENSKEVYILRNCDDVMIPIPYIIYDLIKANLLIMEEKDD